jgi:CheY-like chemotaxis protein
VSAGTAVVQIVVQDTGIGMSDEAQKNLFQVFTQADSSTTRKYGGTGLGLAITKRLVDAMGGTIRVKSQPGQGSMFSIFVPLELRSAAPLPARVALAGLKVLVIDDVQTNRCILEHYLQNERAACVSVPSARAGLDAVREAARHNAPFDLILLDYQMPEMDGLGFLRELRTDPVVAGTKCVVLSSLGDRVPEATALGVNAWLTKPVRLAQLQSVLGRVVGRAQSDVAGSAVESAAAHYPRAKVLLVEDNPVNRQVALRILRSFSIEAAVAEDGAQALARLREREFDLVLMDCQMPVMDGYEATQAFRVLEQDRYGQARRTPVVAMTAHSLHGDREKCLAAGMDDYVSKPVKRAAVGSLLARWLAEFAWEEERDAGRRVAGETN